MQPRIASNYMLIQPTSNTLEYVSSIGVVINPSRRQSGALVALRCTPRLKHQHVPQQILVVSPSREMIAPCQPDRRGIKAVILSQARFAQEILGPVAQRAAQPAVDWYA